MTQSTLQLWLKSVHRCGDIHNAMGEIAGVTSEQYVDISCSRILRDNNDLQTLKDDKNFNKDERRLKSLSSHLIDNGTINCDEAEAIGQKMQETLDEVTMEEGSIKRKGKVRNFEDVMPTTKINDKDIHIDPTTSFSRLTTLANFKEAL